MLVQCAALAVVAVWCGSGVQEADGSRECRKCRGLGVGSWELGVGVWGLGAGSRIVQCGSCVAQCGAVGLAV